MKKQKSTKPKSTGITKSDLKKELTQFYSKIDLRFDGIDLRLGGINIKIDKLDTKIDTSVQSMKEYVNSRHFQIEKKIDKLEDKVINYFTLMMHDVNSHRNKL